MLGQRWWRPRELGPGARERPLGQGSRMDGGPGAQGGRSPGREAQGDRKCRVTVAGRGLAAGEGQIRRTTRAMLSCRPKDTEV